MVFNIDTVDNQGKVPTVYLRNEDFYTTIVLSNNSDVFPILESIFKAESIACELEVQTIPDTPEGNIKTGILKYDGNAYDVELKHISKLFQDVDIL